MSLAFLAKKSWHTSNLRNVEKVWLAEQKHAAEEKKLAELKKNLEEERQMQELRQLQAAHGNKSAAVERLDWMYQGPMASSTNDRSAEEYLLGKEYKPNEAGSDARKLDDNAYGALAMTKAVLPSNDAFSRLNEDPMMLIRSQQKRAQEDILKNPVKMKRIKGEVEKILKDKKEKKKAKKAKKKERKHGKKEKSRRSRSASIGSVASTDSDVYRGRDERQTRRASPSPSRDRDFRGSRDVRRSRDREYSRRHDPHSNSSDQERHERSARVRSRSYDRRREETRRSRSRSADRHRSLERHHSRYPRSPTRNRSRSRDRTSSDHRRRSSSRDSYGRIASSRRRSVERDRSPLRRDPSRDHTAKPHRSNRRSRTPDRRSRTENRESRNTVNRVEKNHRRSSSRDGQDGESRGSKSARREYVVNKPDDGGKYGLIHREGALEAKNVDKTTLGPNTKFLDRAREKKRQESEELRRKLSKSARNESAMSHEEMLKEAARMAEDAKAREAYLTKQAADKREKLDEAEAKLRKDPHFLKQLQDDAYVKGDSSMEERLRRNSHYIQKRAGAGNFLTKD